jgi:hypothetical protein
MTGSKNVAKAVDFNNATVPAREEAMVLEPAKTGPLRNSGKSVSSKRLKSY